MNQDPATFILNPQSPSSHADSGLLRTGSGSTGSVLPLNSVSCALRLTEAPSDPVAVFMHPMHEFRAVEIFHHKA